MFRAVWPHHISSETFSLNESADRNTCLLPMRILNTVGGCLVLTLASSGRADDAMASAAVRGMPPEHMEKLVETLAHCDNQSRSVSLADVNDNFCDCLDGTDEPGTSACSSSGARFTCSNAGFRAFVIPTSRVDDGVCDCCDGSDEAGGVCGDSCAAQAERERERLEHLIEAYAAGSKTRRGYLTEVKKLRGKASESAIERARDRLASLESSKEGIELELAAEEELERKDQEAVAREEITTWESLLQLRPLSADTIGSVLLSLFELTETTVGDIRRATDALGSPAQSGDEHGNPDYAYGDHEHDGYDEYAEYTSPEGAVEEESDDIKDAGSACSLLQIRDKDPASVDERMAELCSAMATALSSGAYTDEHAFILRFILKFVSENRLSHQFFIILGYYHNYQTTFKSDQFYRDRFPDMDPRLDGELDIEGKYGDSGPSMCPSGFRNVGWFCDNASRYTAMMAEYDPTPRESQRAVELRAQRDEVKAAIISRTDTVESLENLRDKITQHADYVEFLALEDLSVSTMDGKFKYSVSMMKTVEQCEVPDDEDPDGSGDDSCSSTVSLGNFNEFSSTQAGDVLMSFTGGTHCHAFGARSSQVLVTCGPDNTLLDATEPSTCFYELHMESPAACTESFSERHGITQYVGETRK